MFIYPNPYFKDLPFIISDGYGDTINCNKDDLIELKNLIENILTNPEDCDTM